MIDNAIEEKVDLAVIAGDYLDEYGSSIKVEDEVLGKASEAIRRLADHCPVFMVQGTYSHEHPGSLNIFAKLQAKHQIYVADKIQQVFLDTDNCFWADEPSPFSETKVVFSALPPVNKAHLMAYQNGGSQEVNQEIKDLLLDVFRGFGQVNDQHECPCIFVGHGTIVGAEVAEGQTLVGQDIEFSINDLRQGRFSASLLGHIHRRQAWDEVMYSGSICQLNFGEEEEKGFNIVTLEGKQLKDVKFIRTPCRPRISIDLGQNPTLESLANLDGNGAYLRIRYQVDEENRNGFRDEDIRKTLSGAYEIKIEKTIIPKERRRAPEISRMRSLEEKLIRWGETVNATIPPGVLTKAKMIEEGDSHD